MFFSKFWQKNKKKIRKWMKMSKYDKKLVLRLSAKCQLAEWQSAKTVDRCTAGAWRRVTQKRVGLVFVLLAPWAKPGNPYWRGRLNTIDLLVKTSLDKLLLCWIYHWSLLQATIMRSDVLSFPFQLVFLGETREPWLKGKAPYGWPSCTN